MFLLRTQAWVRQLLAEDFSAPCREDRFCVPCAAAFCDHCCGARHRGQGHEVVIRAAAAAAAASGGTQPGAAQGPARSGDRDSFCMSCGAGFSAALCGHHAGHDTLRIVVCEGRYCARCTGSEPWFHLFTGIETYRDEKGHILVPLHPRCRGRRCLSCGRCCA
ncbi:hypothetical protein BAE44_0001445 [Dichanthelium oligosanthes]|uniref:Uncharacterized protein n=1 Tax=Dichanthelium oligosanthes TaxID=888268 RepID=A0A1E5WK73_9POAL|nr:hypothetical protein BAE44_0001445 [Dichanthelium oligosanthes]